MGGKTDRLDQLSVPAGGIGKREANGLNAIMTPEKIAYINSLSNPWDRYFYTVCCAVASNCKCLSRQIGAILVRDKSIVSTGYNGSPRGVPHCEGSICPRQEAGYKSGEGLHLCPASHAEINTICNAAKLGVSVDGTVMYMTCGVPCKDCLKYIINAGVREIVCTSEVLYDTLSAGILAVSRDRLSLRTFM